MAVPVLVEEENFPFSEKKSTRTQPQKLEGEKEEELWHEKSSKAFPWSFLCVYWLGHQHRERLKWRSYNGREEIFPSKEKNYSDQYSEKALPSLSRCFSGKGSFF
jgi:hypothetical protein